MQILSGEPQHKTPPPPPRNVIFIGGAPSKRDWASFGWVLLGKPGNPGYGFKYMNPNMIPIKCLDTL